MSLKKEIQSLKDMMSHKEEGSHMSPRNMGDDLSMMNEEVPRFQDDNEEDLYARLPRTSNKLRPNRRSSFYQKGRKPAARPFKSPLDPDFNVGCNNDLLSVTSSVTSEANTSIRNLKKETRNWKLKQQREVSAKLDRPCSEDLRHSRGLHSHPPSLGMGMPGNLLKTTFLSSKVMLHSRTDWGTS